MPPKVASAALKTPDKGGGVGGTGGNKLPMISPSKDSSPNKSGGKPVASKASPKADESKLPVLTPRSAAAGSTPVAAAATATILVDEAAEKAAEEAKKKADEDSERLRLENERIAAEEAEKARKKLVGNGMVTLIYQNYNEQFPIIDGSTTAANIDEVYCLTFVMPECKIHLSKLTPQEKTASEENKCFDVMIDECPLGTYVDLEKDTSYYVYIEEKNDPNQAIRDAERMKKFEAKANTSIYKRNDGRAMEGCSCIYGNPCLDEYGCRDWSNRYAISTANGWKGF